MTPLFRTIVFSLFVLAFIIAGIPSLLHRFGLLHFSISHWNTALPGALTFFLGLLIYILCARNLAVRGRGTPAIWDPPREFVSRGLYRMVRNPMYIGIELILTGEACFFQSPSLLLIAFLMGIIFHLFVIFSEEPTLKKKYGDSYLQYCMKVPRWFPHWPE
jgi:protein-S-isoprenylcysteine O-methyltransferase Ste14